MFNRFRHLVLDRPLAVVDTETTGLDPAGDRVVALAVVRYTPTGDDGAPAEFYQLVDPERPIPPGATAQHGIRDGDVAGMPPFRAVAWQAARFLEGADLAGFNLRKYDLPLLAAEFARAGVSFTLDDCRVVDVLSLYHALEPRDLKSAVRRYCGVEHGSAHDALGDALAAAAVLDAMIGRYPGLPGTVAGLHATQGFVDIEGRFRLDGDRLVLRFGKHAGRSLEEVAASEPGYLKWMLRQGPLPDARAWIERALGVTTLPARRA